MVSKAEVILPATATSVHSFGPMIGFLRVALNPVINQLSSVATSIMEVGQRLFSRQYLNKPPLFDDSSTTSELAEAPKRVIDFSTMSDTTHISSVSAGSDACHPVTKTIESLPYDVLGTCIFRFLEMESLKHLRSCSKSLHYIVDKYAAIEIRRRLRGYETLNTPVLISNLDGCKNIYLPVELNDPSNYNIFQLHQFLLDFGDLIAQKHSLVDPRYMELLQGKEVQGPGDYLDPSMRALLIDWLLEVTVQYRCPILHWHCAVLRLDTVLSKKVILRRKFQLLGIVCLMLEALRSHSNNIGVAQVVTLCDGQYNEADVEECMAFVLEDSYTDTNLVPNFSHTVLEYSACFYFNTCDTEDALSTVRVAYRDSYFDVGDNDQEHLVFVLLLADLSCLDYNLIQYSPFTVALAIVFMSNLVMQYYSKSKVAIGTFGRVFIYNNREALSLG